MTSPHPAQGDAPPDDPSPDAVAEAARACPCVVDLAAEGPALLATHLPGRRVPGVVVRDDAVEVGVVLRLDGRPLPELAAEVRAAVGPVAGGRAVHVAVVDVLAAHEDAEPRPGDPEAG